jgi:NAD(P)H dehydrogenase (quinone)
METKSKKILILFYSTYGHIETMAKKVQEGVNSVPGLKADLYRVPETLSDEVLGKMFAPKKNDEIPTLTYDRVDELANYDGILFGVPTRFGMICAQMKAFWDATGGLWSNGGLVGKPAGFFFSTGTQGGGQETTVFTALPFLAHHGMVFVPPGYTMGKELFSNDEVRGGSAYGAGSYSGADGSRQPSEIELKNCKHQGEYFAKFVARLS